MTPPQYFKITQFNVTEACSLITTQKLYMLLLIWATENNFSNIKLYIFRRKQPQPKHTYLKNRKSII